MYNMYENQGRVQVGKFGGPGETLPFVFSLTPQIFFSVMLFYIFFTYIEKKQTNKQTKRLTFYLPCYFKFGEKNNGLRFIFGAPSFIFLIVYSCKFGKKKNVKSQKFKKTQFYREKNLKMLFHCLFLSPQLLESFSFIKKFFLQCILPAT